MDHKTQEKTIEKTQKKEIKIKPYNPSRGSMQLRIKKTERLKVGLHMNDYYYMCIALDKDLKRHLYLTKNKEKIEKNRYIIYYEKKQLKRQTKRALSISLQISSIFRKILKLGEIEKEACIIMLEPNKNMYTHEIIFSSMERVP